MKQKFCVMFCIGEFTFFKSLMKILGIFHSFEPDLYTEI
jgi:hypothetical protein